MTKERHTVTPYLCVHNATDAVDFYKKLFGATEIGPRITMPDGKVGHTEIDMGGITLMVSDEFPEMEVVSARTLGGSPIHLQILVDDADLTVSEAVAAGSDLLSPVADQFHGDRSGSIRDPFGIRWTIATPVEEVSDDEVIRRANKLFGGA